MLIPIVVLIVFCIVGMLYVGGFWDPAAEGYQESRPGASATPTRSLALPWGSLIALVFTFIYLLLPPRGGLQGIHEVPDAQGLQRHGSRHPDPHLRL